MYRNMVTSLLEHERIETTDAKAKEVRRIAERMITLGKRGDLHARRQALRVIRSRDVAAKVFDDLAERYRERPGGYTRVLKLRTRPGDAASLSLVELIEGVATPVAEPEKRARRKAKRAEPAEAEKAAKKKGSTGKTGPKAAAKKTSARKATSKKTPVQQKKTRKKSGG
jgi:large subunit ribosomal protein L17